MHFLSLQKIDFNVFCPQISDKNSTLFHSIQCWAVFYNRELSNQSGTLAMHILNSVPTLWQNNQNVILGQIRWNFYDTIIDAILSVWSIEVSQQLHKGLNGSAAKYKRNLCEQWNWK